MRIRFAGREDKRAVAALCRRSVGPGDYVLRTLDFILARGGVLVAWDGRRAIGMGNLDDCVGGGLWLSMARTDRAYRRRGVNSAILERAVEIARRRGHRHLRMWSNAPNVAGTSTAEANGFQGVARFFGVYRPALRSPPESEAVRVPSGAVARASRSPTVRDLGGYVHLDWYFVKPSREVVAHVASSGGLRRLGDDYFLSTRDERFGASHWFEFQILGRGSVRALREGARLAGAAGIGQAFTYLPDSGRYRRHARQAGYRTVAWGSEAILYERRV